mgnify:CR=1 FL=1
MPRDGSSDPADAPKVGVRSTRQREAIVDLLGEQDVFISAQDVHSRLRDLGQRIGLTTVYRTLQSLVDVGAVDTLLGHRAPRTLLLRAAPSAVVTGRDAVDEAA